MKFALRLEQPSGSAVDDAALNGTNDSKHTAPMFR